MVYFNGKMIAFSPKIVTKGEEPSGELSITENGTYDVKSYASASVKVSGSVEPTPELDETFANNDWSAIIWACQNNAVPDNWAVGDEKAMQIGENEVIVAICGKNHDEYADGGFAPLTFIQKKAFMSARMNEKMQMEAPYGSLKNTPYTETDMYKTTLPSIIEMMPEEVKAALRSVKKKNTIDGVKTAFFDTAEKVWLFSEGEVGGGWINFEDGKKYDYPFWNCMAENESLSILFFLRSYSATDYFIVYSGDREFQVGSPTDAQQIEKQPVIFGFCF